MGGEGAVTLHPVLIVFFFGLFTALATGGGAVPFTFVRTVSARAVAHANGIASGLMLGASFGLLIEGSEHGIYQAVVGANLGVVFILLTQRYLAHRDFPFGSATGLWARRTLLMVLVMTIHSVAEGIAVGAAFAGERSLAVLITAAIAVHNIPEGLAISAVLRPRGASVAACAGWSIFSSLPQPLMAVPAFLFVEAFAPTLPYAMGFAAGAMVFMVFVELLPEAYDHSRKPIVGLLVGITLVGMMWFQRYL
jgi:zinc transporter ZupT